MTAISNSFSSPFISNGLKYFTIEIVTFDGEHFIEEIEAYDAEEAQAEAASMYDDVDYTMCQGYVVA